MRIDLVETPSERSPVRSIERSPMRRSSTTEATDSMPSRSAARRRSPAPPPPTPLGRKLPKNVLKKKILKSFERAAWT
jgi:hypothetical protein